MDMYPATSTSNPRWRFWGKALAPPTGMGTFLRQVGHWRLFWGPTFSISLWRHWQQKECRHGSILGSLKGPKHIWQVTWCGRQSLICRHSTDMMTLAVSSMQSTDAQAQMMLWLNHIVLVYLKSINECSYECLNTGIPSENVFHG